MPRPGVIFKCLKIVMFHSVRICFYKWRVVLLVVKIIRRRPVVNLLQF